MYANQASRDIEQRIKRFLFVRLDRSFPGLPDTAQRCIRRLAEIGDSERR